MRRDPAGHQLRVGELSTPEKVRRAVDKHGPLLREVMSGDRFFHFNRQIGLSNFLIFVSVRQKLRIKIERPNLVRSNHGGLTQFLRPSPNLGGDHLQDGPRRSIRNA